MRPCTWTMNSTQNKQKKITPLPKRSQDLQFLLTQSGSNLLSEETCKSQVLAVPREKLTPSDWVWWLGFILYLSLSHREFSFTLWWLLIGCPAVTRPLIGWFVTVKIYIIISKLPLGWFYFCSNILTDVAICKRKSSSFLDYISEESNKRILKSSWICRNRSSSLWQD